MRLAAIFPKTPRSGGVAELRWSDGTVATTPLYTHPGRLPHDLEHYVVEAHVDLPFGFWALAGAQTPFNSFTLVSGCWQRGARERFERRARKHPGAMLQGEAASFVHELAQHEDDLTSAWSVLRRRIRRTYSYEADSPIGDLEVGDVRRIIAFDRALHRTWADLPVGGALQVSWPPATDRMPTVISV
ncbi:MAG TPA: hypothetical protein VM143_01425 [Acidimicrobiales bacterium]|nr:hypothetical protein [Acidimicrobiales bacterium]